MLNWGATTNAPWISFSSSLTTLTVSVNPGGLSAMTYTGTIAVTAPGSSNSPQTITVNLIVTAAASSIVVTSVANAASGAGGAIAPGELVTIKGTGLGPPNGVSFSVDTTDGLVDSKLAGTQVFFGTFAAPITYTSAGQINVIVPYEISGQSLVVMQAMYQNAASAGTTLQVASAAPGIFTAGGTGTGEAVAANQDLSINGSSTPALAGSYVTVYFTGGGQMNPPGVTGSVTGSVIKRLTQDVSVTVGGQPATVSFAGAAPGFVDGVGQLNIQLAPNTPAGPSEPIIMVVGGISSPPIATLSIQGPASPSLQGISLNPASVTGGASTTATIALTGAAPASGVQVGLVSNNPSAQVPPTVSVPAEHSSMTVPVTTTAVTSTQTATITATLGTQSIATTLTLTTVTPPVNLAVSSVSITPSTLSAAMFATLSVTLNGTAATNGASVSVQSNNPTAFPVPTVILVPAGQSTNGVSVQAGAVGNSTVVTVTASFGSTSQTTSVTVVPSAINQLLVTPTVFQPQFTVGDAAASLGFEIRSQNGGPLLGSIKAVTNSAGQWLLADGLATYNWTAPETVNVTANPAGLSAGMYSGTLTITAPAASNSPVMIPVTMTILPQLQIVTSSLPDAVGGQPYSAQLQATGGTGYVWSLQSGSLPVGLTLSASGLISGTPPQVSGSSTYPVNIGLRDAAGRFVYQGFTITLRPGLAITLSGPASFQFVVGQPYTNSSNSISFQASGGITPYTLSATGMPPGLTVNSSSGLVTGTPTQPGTFPAIITVRDTTRQSFSANFNLVVVTTPMLITNSDGTTPAMMPPGTVGVSYLKFLNAAGGSQSGYAWSIIQGNLPPGITQQPAPGCPTNCGMQISGTPTQAGTFNFAAQVKDSLGNAAQQSFSLIVNSGTPPTITTTTLTLGTVGQTYSFPFAASGGAGGYTWSFLGSGPDPGLALSSMGVLQGTSSVPNDCPTGPAIWIGSQAPFGTFSSSSFQVEVTDSAGHSANKQFCLPAYYPTPQVSSVNPSTIPSDGQTHVLTITGNNFRNNAAVYVQGKGYITASYVNSTTLTISVTSNPSNGWGTGSYTFWAVQPYANVSNMDKSFSIQ